MSTHQSIEICCLICVFIKSHWTDKATITYLSSDFCCHLSRFLTAKILYCNSMLILSPVLSIICVPSSLEHHSPLYPGAFATVQHILNICKNSGWVCAGCQVSYHTLFFFFLCFLLSGSLELSQLLLRKYIMSMAWYVLHRDALVKPKDVLSYPFFKLFSRSSDQIFSSIKKRKRETRISGESYKLFFLLPLWWCSTCLYILFLSQTCPDT